MKRIGVVSICIGGTSLFYNYFIKEAVIRFNKHNPEVFIHQMSLSEIDQAFSELTIGNVDPIEHIILSSIEQMQHQGVEIIVIPNNAVHSIIDNIRQKSPLPIVNMILEVVQSCIHHKVNRPLILGSNWVVNNKIFDRKLYKKNICAISPSQEIQNLIHNAIIDSMVTGSISHNQQIVILDYINHIKITNKCDGIIMACSDIVRMLEDVDVGIPKLNPMYALAEGLFAII